MSVSELAMIKTNNKILPHSKFPHLSRLAELMTKKVAKERLIPIRVIKEIMMNKLERSIDSSLTQEKVDFSALFEKVKDFN